MASNSVVSGFIDRLKIGNNGAIMAIGSSAYGISSESASTAAKVVNMTDFYLHEGVTIHVKFLHENTASNPTLNVNDTGAKGIVLYGNTKAGTDGYTTGWQAGAVLTLTYDGTNWVNNQSFNELDVPTLIVKTTAEWASTPTLKPEAGTIAVYSDRGTVTVNNQTYDVPGIKIANGTNLISDQPFVGDDVKEEILTLLNNHINDTTRHITSTERTFWNNKLNCDVDGETLQLNRQ